MQVASIVEVLQGLSVAGSITEEDSNWLNSCALSAKAVDTVKGVSLDPALGEELWVAAESHAISLVYVKRCISMAYLSTTCSTLPCIRSPVQLS